MTSVKPYKKPDLILGLSQSSINDFLLHHKQNNSGFYNRSRENSLNNPIYEHDFEDDSDPKHPVMRRVRFWANVEQPLEVTLERSQQTSADYIGFWKKKSGGDIKPTDFIPPNILLRAPKVTLDVNFPKLDNPTSQSPAPEHELSMTFTIEASCFATIQSDETSSYIRVRSEYCASK